MPIIKAVNGKISQLIDQVPSSTQIIFSQSEDRKSLWIELPKAWYGLKIEIPLEESTRKALRQIADRVPFVDYQKIKEEAIADPKPGDYWHELASPQLLVVQVTKTHVIYSLAYFTEGKFRWDFEELGITSRKEFPHLSKVKYSLCQREGLKELVESWESNPNPNSNPAPLANPNPSIDT